MILCREAHTGDFLRRICLAEGGMCEGSRRPNLLYISYERVGLGVDHEYDDINYQCAERIMFKRKITLIGSHEEYICKMEPFQFKHLMYIFGVIITSKIHF